MSSVVNTILLIDDEMMLLYNNTNEYYGTSAAHRYEVPITSLTGSRLTKWRHCSGVRGLEQAVSTKQSLWQ